MKEINVDFTCPNCETNFKLDPRDILERDFICCPNCECCLSEEELSNLKIAIRHMLDVH
ncbi:hypothetical protein JOC37_001917 [Desulfohalotomaculum tongense]|uniref:hypothetical protein n=1 Tax=Desulforadius tongensis TaxID=1216062 RepID=UPI0019569DE0|nr:hypothetical protein [Desulforadius tongensis]MBM7855520.1 hypothetical protein [Desulforadius tongensis]